MDNWLLLIAGFFLMVISIWAGISYVKDMRRQTFS
ncbi:TPA: small membrane protein, partial [Escherichia coli]|nr:small membrane protein [Escherichia coli]